jgi:hypothetical protein
VIAAYPKLQKVLVEGVGRVKKHTRISSNQRGAQSGGIVTQDGRHPDHDRVRRRRPSWLGRGEGAREPRRRLLLWSLSMRWSSATCVTTSARVARFSTL